MKCTIIIVLIVTSQICLSQHNSVARKEIIGKIATYRSELLERSQDEGKNIELLFKKLNSLSVSSRKKKEIISNLLKLYVVDNYEIELIKTIVRNHIGDNEFINGLTLEDFETLKSEIDMVDLIIEGVLKEDYPHVIQANSDLLEELLFYDIQEGEQILEVGAGNGTIGILISLLGQKGFIYLNELSPIKIKMIDEKLKRTATYLPVKIKSIQGLENNTNLENIKVDKILIRNTFHHFDKKKKMLKSIKASMKSSSYLYLLEQFKGKNSNEYCEQAMKRKKLEKILNKSGFEQCGETKIGLISILEFKIKN